jgi:hypothetical protein
MVGEGWELRIIALPMEKFESLLQLDDEALEANGSRRMVAEDMMREQR